MSYILFLNGFFKGSYIKEFQIPRPNPEQSLIGPKLGIVPNEALI